MTLAARATRSVTGCSCGRLSSLVVQRAGFAAADVQDQLRHALDVFGRQRRVDAALEAVSGVGGEVEAPRASGHRLRPPEGRFHVHMARVVRHRGGIAAHDAGQRLDRLRIGDHADRGVDVDGVAVEQLQALARAAPAHHQLVVDLVQVEDVRRPAVLEHHVVGDVDQRRHRALAAARQALDHPRRRLRLRIDVAHDAAGEAPAQVGRFHLHRQRLVVPRRNGFDQRRQQRRAGQRRDLARHAVDAERMRQVGRQLEREHGVVQRQQLADVGAHRRIGRQLEQAAMVVGQLQLARRAQHAEAVDAAQLADLDGEGRAALFRRRQLGTDQCQRHADAHTRVGRAADDLQRPVGRMRAGQHLAHAQAVGIGVLHRLDDLGHDHALARRRHGAGVFHLQPGHGQQVGQFGGGDGRVAELAQPGFGELHGSGRASLELRQEAQVAIEEQAQVVHAIAQHRQPVRAHAEGEADVRLGIQAEVAHHVRMHLAGAGHLEPAALQRPAGKGDVDLGRRFGEGKEARAGNAPAVRRSRRTGAGSR